MGLKRARVDELIAAIQEKDAQTERLEQEVQAYAARASHMQTRFLSTLDTLDELQTKHRLELAENQDEIRVLRSKLSRYVTHRNEAVAEQDDMRDAVMELVEKVERSNDYSLWPHSRIRMARPAEPSNLKRSQNILLKPPDPLSDDDLHSYASAIITSLRVERDLERKAHALTRRDAEQRITSLEAQLARRDAELESCILHTQHMSSIQAAEENNQKNRKSGRVRRKEDRSMTEEDIITVLETTAARNRALELEVKQIAARLDRAQAPTTAQELHPESELPRYMSPKHPGDHDQLPRKSPAQSADGIMKGSPKRPPGNGMEITALEGRGNSEPCALQAEHSPEDKHIQLPRPPAITPRSDFNRTSDPGARNDAMWTLDDNTVIWSLKTQIELLGNQVEAFREERDKLAKLVSDESGRHEQLESRTVPDPGTEGHRQLASHDRSTNDDHLGNDSDRSSQAELLRQIRKLQDLLLRFVPLVPVIHQSVQCMAEEEAQREDGVDSVSEGEQSMELETPLMGTIEVSKTLGDLEAPGADSPIGHAIPETEPNTLERHPSLTAETRSPILPPARARSATSLSTQTLAGRLPKTRSAGSPPVGGSPTPRRSQSLAGAGGLESTNVRMEGATARGCHGRGIAEEGIMASQSHRMEEAPVTAGRGGVPVRVEGGSVTGGRVQPGRDVMIQAEPVEERVVRIEAELEVARRELEERGALLEGVRAEVGALRAVVGGRDSAEGEGEGEGEAKLIDL